MGQVISEYETGGLVRHTTWQPVEMPRVSRGRAKIACRKARKRSLAVATGSFLNEATRHFRRPAGSWGIATGCRGSYVDEPLSLHVKAGVNAGSTYWYHLDRQYNVIGLTNSSGQVVERYAYSAYGARRVLDPNGVTERSYSALGNARGHQGLWHDDESGLIYNRARYRSAALGRWMGRDPSGYSDGLNLFAAYQSMRGGLDPTGQIWWLILRTMARPPSPPNFHGLDSAYEIVDVVERGWKRVYGTAANPPRLDNTQANVRCQTMSDKGNFKSIESLSGETEETVLNGPASNWSISDPVGSIQEVNYEVEFEIRVDAYYCKCHHGAVSWEELDPSPQFYFRRGNSTRNEGYRLLERITTTTRLRGSMA